MTTFIPEWGPVSGRELQLRRVLQDLGERAAVNKPLRAVPDSPDFFLEHDEHGWLALALCSARYADIGDGQLFAPDGRAAFLRYLGALNDVLAGALPGL
jgi:hypothetical protein